ncbi:MAG: DUF86 domain-containing protein [Anaerolineae bacterium]|nr:DUF86 domain-containing protein [Anaerolineae bacterium]
MKESQQYLRDILIYLTDVEKFTVDGRDAFRQDRKTQFAVIRAYEVIGEIVKRLPEDLLNTQPEIEWQDIKAFRDFLAHNYDRVQLDIVWGAVIKLSELKTAIETMLTSLEDS